MNEESRGTAGIDGSADNLATLRDLLAGTGLAAIGVDRHARLRWFTPAAAGRFALSEADLGQPLDTVNSPLADAGLGEDVHCVLRDGRTLERELSDPTGRWYLAQAGPCRGPEGIHGVVLNLLDITRRKREEQALRDAEQRYRTLVQAAAQIVWSADADGRLEQDCEAWRTFTGQSFDQWSGDGWLEAVHPGDRALVTANWRHCAASRQPFIAEFRLYHAASGGYRWVAAHAVPLQEAEGGGGGWAGMLSDVTDRKATDAARSHFQRLFEAAPGLYLVLEPDQYRIVTASNAYLEAVGAERAAILGRRLFDVFPDDWAEPGHDGVHNLAASLERVRSLRQSDVLALQRYPLPLPDGRLEVRFWSALNVPVFGLDGELVYIIHRIEDVTPFVQRMRAQEREAEAHELLESRAEYLQADIALRAADLQRLNEELQALNETLERRVELRTEQVRRLASSLAMAEHDERARVGRVLHDSLQQLLYGIQLKMALLAEEAVSAGQHQLKTYADEARYWIGVAVDTTRQISVDLSPPLLGDDTLADGLEWLQTQMRELHQLEVELAVDSDIRLPDEGLRVLLFQTVRELLFNVVRHAGTERAVVTAHEVDDDQGRLLAIEIRDDGRGFDPAVLEQEGELRSGFGLASLRGRLDLFGGRLDVEARPGAGSRLTVYLPRSAVRLAHPTGERKP